ncbi:hypothetical protein D3C84_1176050 [compost metagenome]
MLTFKAKRAANNPPMAPIPTMAIFMLSSCPANIESLDPIEPYRHTLIRLRSRTTDYAEANKSLKGTASRLDSEPIVLRRCHH